MKHYSIAVWDRENNNLLHEISAGYDEFDAFKNCGGLWYIIVENEEKDKIPNDIETLIEACDAFSLEVSIIEIII